MCVCVCGGGVMGGVWGGGHKINNDNLSLNPTRAHTYGGETAVMNISLISAHTHTLKKKKCT